MQNIRNKEGKEEVAREGEVAKEEDEKEEKEDKLNVGGRTMGRKGKKGKGVVEKGNETIRGRM